MVKHKRKTILLVSILALAILLSCSIGIISGGGNTANAFSSVADITSQSYNIGELVVSGSGNKAIFSGSVFWELVSLVTGVSNPNNSTLASWNTLRTSADFRSANSAHNNLDLTITINGLSWTPTYLSYNTSNEPILTLWLSMDTLSAKYNEQAESTVGKYPNNMYGTSKIRVVSLNNGGDWAATYNAANLTHFDSETSSPWAIYTVDKSKKIDSIKEFIEVPDKMSWQHLQSAKTEIGFLNDTNNDALDQGATFSAACNFYTNAAVNTDGKHTTYQAWKNDTLWLPSVSEVGYNGAENGKWKTSANQNHSSKNAWLRSGRSTDPNYVHYMANIDENAWSLATEEYALRPAFHLNLKKAQGALALLQPKYFEAVYNGEVQTLETLKNDSTVNPKIDWYNSDYSVSSKVTVQYYDGLNATGNIVSGAKNAGDYSIKFTIVDTANIKWWDYSSTNTDPSRIVNFKILQKTIGANFNTSSSTYTVAPLAGSICSSDSAIASSILQIKYTGRGTTSYNSYTAPEKVGNYKATVEIATVTGASNYKLNQTYTHDFDINTNPVTLPTLNHLSQEYNGNNKTFELVYAPNMKSHIVATLANSYNGKITDAGGAYRVILGGTYTDAIKLSLNNPYNPQTGEGRNVWSDTNNSNDRYLTITVTPKALDKFAISEASGGILNGITESTLNITMDYILCSPFNSDEVSYTIYAQKGSNDPIEIGAGIAKGAEYSQQITLDFSRIYTDGDYVLSIKADEGETNYTVALSSPVTLRMSEPTGNDDIKWRLMKETVLANEAPVVAQIGETEKAFPTSKVFDGSAYTFSLIMPSGYNSSAVTYTKDGNPVNQMTDAGEYVASVTLSNGGNTRDYTITFVITPKKFDLSSVKWENNGVYEYTGAQISPAFTGLPDELEIKNLLGAHINGTDAKSYGTVTATLKIADNYVASNYILPEQGEADSYDGSFEWSVDWEIVPAQIKINWDYKDVDGAFQVLNLTDSRVDGKIDYLYYETNSSGQKVDENADGLTVNDIEVDPAHGKYYIAYPKLQSIYEGNYEFPSDANLYSPVFKVGGDVTEINVSLTTDEYTYNRKPVALKWATGTPVNSLTFTYYRGEVVDEANMLEGAPIDAGLYIVVVSAKSGFVVGGDTEFPFEIKKSVVTTDWKEQTKTPVLKLEYGQIYGIEYEIRNSSGAIVEVVDGKLAPGEYTIKAKIKDDQQKNYIFDNEGYESGTVSFTINEGDDVHDPNDPNNPNYPEDPDDNPNPNPTPDPGDGGEDGGNGFIDFFKRLIEKKFPLWQIATIAVGALLSLIFAIKTVQYNNRKKNATGEAKKYNAKTYSAFLPVFATDVVLAGLTNKVWSIIAFSMVGVTVLMFVLALITRKNWKKALVAKETAIENSEQRKIEAEKQERREFQERMTQVSAGASGQNADNSALIEELRREMEERHRQEMDAMKMMLANMMGRVQSDNGMTYASMEDTELLVQKVIAGLLPTVQSMIPEPTAYLTAPSEQNEDLMNVVAAQNEEMKAMSAEITAMRQEIALLSAGSTTTTVFVERDPEDEEVDDEEEWDSILDEDEDDFLEAVVVEEDGTVTKTSPNFRMRLKQSSDKNREWYTVIKNMFCSQKGITYRVYKRVEKIRYQGQVIGVIGIAKRSIKLWLALKPYEYDARRYHHKDVSDKPRFVDVPMYVRVGSDRALERAQELILALFQDLNMEARKRYNDRDIQELIFTMKHNRLLTNKENKKLLCEVMHVHDCDVLDDETAQKCIETKNVEFIDESVIETVKLDDIDAHFQDGNRVTLEKLRKAGLVSAECTGVSIVADKRLTKPLIIVANDFSLTAVKLITLTGGRAIKLTQVAQQ